MLRYFQGILYILVVILMLSFLCKVGDPKQLPATVLSNVASKFLYECSMFERLQRAGHPVTMLTKQVSLNFSPSKLDLNSTVFAISNDMVKCLKPLTRTDFWAVRY